MKVKTSIKAGFNPSARSAGLTGPDDVETESNVNG
jgi:hypothetical protein